MCTRSASRLAARLAVVVTLVFLGGNLAACGSESASTDAQELTVSAASSLKSMCSDLGPAFDTATGSTTIFNHDASGTLQKQIEGGSPVDVFASAAMKQVNALLDQKLVDADSVQVFAGNEIVIVVPADSTLGIAGFEDLTKPEVQRVTYGDPATAPHGVAAEEVLTTLGLMEQVRPKVIYAANISQALTYVSSGEVDAAIFFATEAVAAGDRVKVVATSQPAWHSTISYPIAIVSASKNKALGQRLIDFVMGPEGQSILEKHGFLPAPAQ